LHQDRLKGEHAHAVLSIARNTFCDFLYVLMIALVFLVPHQVPLSLTIALLVLGVASGVGIITRETRRFSSSPYRHWELRWVLRQLALPAISSLGLIGVAIASAQFEAIYMLVGVIAALLLTACWNA
jgi:hypothetical protein